ncbi:MAG: hypothetical protein QOF95_94 [Pseudonocardiales bacterium]|nr:hypothetical protein [Pseudonocardiales bacterium]
MALQVQEDPSTTTPRGAFAPRPVAPDELITATSGQAQRVPDGPVRERPGAAFAPGVVVDSVDDWDQTLAMLGRR